MLSESKTLDTQKPTASDANKLFRCAAFEKHFLLFIPISCYEIVSIELFCDEYRNEHFVAKKNERSKKEYDKFNSIYLWRLLSMKQFQRLLYETFGKLTY